MTDDRDYEVGYGKTPVSTRFKPGQCGHRAGRPKQKLSEVDELLKALRTKVKLPDGRRLTKLQLGFEQLKRKSVQGDMAAGELIAKIRESLQNVASTDHSVMDIMEFDLNA